MPYWDHKAGFWPAFILPKIALGHTSVRFFVFSSISSKVIESKKNFSNVSANGYFYYICGEQKAMI